MGPRILILDNFDSFTYNLHHILSQFSHKCDVVRSDNLDQSHISDYDKIIFSPGPSLPCDHPAIFELLDRYHSEKSILGICLGHQAIGQYFGGSIKNMDVVKHGVVSNNTIVKDDILFQSIPNEFTIGHYHSWILDENSFADCLEVTSKNDDNYIMSFKHNEFDIRGLQFHPESILTDYGSVILKNWALV